MEHVHNAIKQVRECCSQPRLAQAPGQILFIGVRDTAQTLIFVLAEWHGCRFRAVMGVAGGVAAQLRP